MFVVCFVFFVSEQEMFTLWKTVQNIFRHVWTDFGGCRSMHIYCFFFAFPSHPL